MNFVITETESETLKPEQNLFVKLFRLWKKFKTTNWTTVTNNQLMMIKLTKYPKCGLDRCWLITNDFKKLESFVIFGYGTDIYAFVCYAIRHKVTGELENQLMYTWGMFQIDIF